MLVSAASNLTLLTKEHFGPRDFKKIPKASVAYLQTETLLSQHFAMKRGEASPEQENYKATTNCSPL